jgi:thiol:disulfide interchange protein
MKNLFMTIAALAFVFTMQAQSNEDVNETTKVKKVTEKGTTVKTKVTKETKTAKDVIKVEGNEKQDQSTMRVTNFDKSNEVIEEKEVVDPANTSRMMEIQRQKEMELKESIKQQMQAAEKEKQMIMEQKAQREKQMMERRAMLEKRPDGMVRLNKDIDGDGIK